MIEADLRNLRRELKVARAIERAVRWGFLGLLLGCLHLVGSKFFGLPLPAALLLLVPVIPLAIVLREGGRRVSLRDCAVFVDRELRLEERVATALESGGALGGAVEADARKHFDRMNARSLGRVRWPRETPFAALAALVALALWAVPAPERSAPSDPALQAAAREERARLLEGARIADTDAGREAREMAREMGEIARLLESGTPEAAREALRRLRLLEERAAARMNSKDLSPRDLAALREIAGRASGSGAALSRVLERRGSRPEDGNRTFPTVVKKLERPGTEGGGHSSGRPSEFVVKDAESRGGGTVEAREALVRRLARRDWPARCDAAVRRYFSD